MKKSYFWAILLCIISILIYSFYIEKNSIEVTPDNIITQWVDKVIH